MVNVCYCLNFPELPLKGNYEETKYKLYFADSGLLVAMLDEDAQEDLRAVLLQAGGFYAEGGLFRPNGLGADPSGGQGHQREGKVPADADRQREIQRYLPRDQADRGKYRV